MAVEERELRELLTSEAATERRAWKRSSLLVGIIAFGGLLWLCFTAYKVIRLERESSRLSTNIQQQTTQLNQLQTNANSARAALDETNLQLKKAADALSIAKARLETIATSSRDTTTKAQAHKALGEITNVSKGLKSAVSPPTLMPGISYGDVPNKRTPPPQDSETSKSEPVDYTKIFSDKEVTQQARILSRPSPYYTEEARRNSVQGSVTLRVVFATSGQVTNIRALKSLPDGLTEQAMMAAKQIKFQPAIKDGRAVSQYVTLQYDFRLY